MGNIIETSVFEEMMEAEMMEMEDDMMKMT